MEKFSLIYATIGVSLLLCLIKFLIWSWWKPWRLDRALRAQGLKGTTYRFLLGDLKENTRINKEARSKPMSVNSHSIIPRVAPLLLDAINKYGKISFTWFGTIPRVALKDPELIREVLSNKFGHFGKPKIGPFGRLLASGLASYDGEKWAKHRRIINPVFHVEKLKNFPQQDVDPVLFEWRCSPFRSIDAFPSTVSEQSFRSVSAVPSIVSVQSFSRCQSSLSYSFGRGIHTTTDSVMIHAKFHFSFICASHLARLKEFATIVLVWSMEMV